MSRSNGTFLNDVVRPKLRNSDSNEIGIQNHLTRKRTLNHLAKWLIVRLKLFGEKRLVKSIMIFLAA